MLTTIAWKEFRELLPIVVIALALQIFFLGLTMSALEGSTLWQDLAGCGRIVMALAVPFMLIAGYWQNITEKNQGTLLYLMHRPAHREWIAVVKLLAGGILTLLVMTLPVLCFALWVDRRGVPPKDINLSTTVLLWTAGLPTLYLGAFLSTFRPAQLFGSLLWPTLAAICIFALLEVLALEYSHWWALILIAPAIDFCFVIAILYVAATRDYS